MKNYKRMISLMLAVLMLLGILSGIGAASDDTAETTIQTENIEQVDEQSEDASESDAGSLTEDYGTAIDPVTGEEHPIREKALADKAPLYRETAAYAREHDELDAYRASFQANVACKEAIEKAINENYHDNRLDTSCVQGIIDRFGQERVEHVLAATVTVKTWDKRFSDSNRVWAVTHCIPEDDNGLGDRRRRLAIDQCHPGLTDLFITAFRKKVRETEQSQGIPKRESVLALLKQPVSEHVTPHRPRTKSLER